MTVDTILPTAEVLATRCEARWPGESAEYRAARTALLAEEIELRRQIERVAEQRRALPDGPEVAREYSFEGPEGPVTLEALFGDKPHRERRGTPFQSDGGLSPGALKRCRCPGRQRNPALLI